MTGASDEAVQSVDRRYVGTGLDRGDRRLGDVSATREVALGQRLTAPSLSEKATRGSRRHCAFLI
jgi:hypothetical protein